VTAGRARQIQGLTGTGRRDEAARQLLASWQADELGPEDLRLLIPDIWLYLDPPAGPWGPLHDDEWIEIFGATGFFVQGPDVSLHGEYWDLFRAAPHGRARGMSWCTRREMAERFLPKHNQYGAYTIWSAAVPQTAILAVLYRSSDAFLVPGAREVVVNPAGLPDPVAVS
jgi:hypothetical protein